MLTDEQIRYIAKKHSFLNKELFEFALPGRARFARDVEAAACAERDARIAEFVAALDEEMVVSHLGVFNSNDDPRKVMTSYAVAVASGNTEGGAS